MFFRSGLLLSFCAVLLQVAVFLQALLPEQYQISPVCETITRALLSPPSTHALSSSHVLMNMQKQDANLHESQHHTYHHVEHTSTQTSHDHHDINHQCQYCTVYANLVLPPELGVKEVLERIQIRLLFFKRQLAHIYFVLQRLFLLPQGRAPPVLA